MMQGEMVDKWTVWLEVIRTGGTVLIALIGVWTLVITRKVHTLTNSGMDAMKAANAKLRLDLGISRENEAMSAGEQGRPQPPAATITNE